eukprot:CAMPEP_0183441516 /NCGR_PEP_ID=MMETSP0370-20130417/84987_1 /TAXON_ID=268820 /ORGANISM="Peridinium aciculiferum, Strain PAER-2" /LENGTH=92 /DNA_ID=CAMNT_0025630741 /DNA_START=86 /DNA_END=360 /DNA_ORIENTATION=+
MFSTKSRTREPRGTSRASIFVHQAGTEDASDKITDDTSSTTKGSAVRAGPDITDLPRLHAAEGPTPPWTHDLLEKAAAATKVTAARANSART